MTTTRTTATRHRQRIPTVNRAENLDLIRIEEAEVILCGKPEKIKGSVTLTNLGTTTIVVSELPLDNAEQANNAGFPVTLRINKSLRPNETRTITVKAALPPHTPAGSYSAEINLNGTKYAMRYEVIDHYALSFCPRKFVKQGVTASKKYDFKLRISNHGNVPYVIPRLGHTLNRDMQYTCKARSQSVVRDAKNGMQAFEDGIAKYTSLNYVGWSGISIKETGTAVQPGETLSITLSVTLPDKVDVNASYYGDVILAGNQLIGYQILA